MAEDNPKMTISELHNAINYDEEAKKVLQAYINSGFGDNIASEHFVHNKSKIIDAEAKIKATETETVEPLQNDVERGKIENTKTTDNINESVGEENDIDNGRTISEGDRLHSEVQVEKGSEAVQDRSADRQHTAPSERTDTIRHQNTSRRVEQIETGELEDVVKQEKFTQLRQNIGDSISKADFSKIWEIYSHDSRLIEGYEFIDVVTYDMLTDTDNDLRTLFIDEIAEYFNQNNSLDVDSTGMSISKSVLERLKDSIVRNAKGQLIPLYHATDKDFDKFEIGDIGFHFGSYYQAYHLAKNKEILENARFIKVYLNITKPLIIEKDNNLWHTKV